jgi:hypothetical protein
VNRAELGALRDAIDTILNWPDSVRDQIARFKAAPNLYPSHLAARALVNWGLLLGSADEALPIFDEVIDRFSASEEDGLCEQVEKALTQGKPASTSACWNRRW